MLSNFIGQKVRLVIYKNNQVQIDMICRQLDKDITGLFSQYKFIDYHKTKITGLNVITLVKE